MSAASTQLICANMLLEVEQKMSNFPAVDARIYLLSRRHRAPNLYHLPLERTVRDDENMNVESKKGLKCEVEWLLEGHQVVARWSLSTSYLITLTSSQ